VKPQRFFAEIRRRRVLRVVGVYAVGAWAAIEVTATVFPLLHFPESAATYVVYLALLGFPVTVALAWIFDLTPHGVVRTPAMAPGEDVAATPPAPAPRSQHRGLAGRAAGFFGLGMLVALVTVAAYLRFGPSTPFTPSADGIESIAVLPFADLSATKDQEFFADGMTEELLDRLAHVDGLRVAARTSSFAFKGHNEDIKEIGAKLGVEAVLEGSIRRENDQLRVTAQLIDARSGYHLWSETFDHTVASVFAIQDTIANTIVDRLRMQFAGSDPGSLRETENVRAHDLYLQGKLRWHYRGEDNLRQAIDYFEQALKEDPAYAPAWAGIAQSYAVLPSVSSFPAEEAIAKGTAAAAKALALDARLPEAHAALGQIAQSFEWNFEDAERAYRRAISFNPSYATAHQWYAETLMMLGRLDEARDEIGRALELDPLSPSALSVRAYVSAIRGETEGAVGQYREVTSLYPDYTLGQLNRVFLDAYLHLEDPGAVAGIADGDTAVASAVRTILANGGVGSPATYAAAERLVAGAPPALAALWYAAAGEKGAALDRLDEATRRPDDPNVPFILLHPLLGPLHADPRFREIVGRVGIVVPSIR
jgi:adenylate cyclase